MIKSISLNNGPCVCFIAPFEGEEWLYFTSWTLHENKIFCSECSVLGTYNGGLFNGGNAKCG